MKCLLIELLTILFIKFCVSAKDSEAKFDPEWDDWKKEHGKKYDSLFDEVIRREIFRDKENFVNEHNAKFKNGEVSFDVELDEYADLTRTEFLRLRAGLEMPSSFKILESKQRENTNKIYEGSLKQSTITVSASNFSWVSLGKVTKVKNQGKCAACWAFTAIAALESQLAIKGKGLLDLSEQQLVNCDLKNFGCLGGWPYITMDGYQKNNGSTSDSSFPYVGTLGSCKTISGTTYKTIASTKPIQLYGNETALRDLVKNSGPVVAAVYVSTSFIFYKSGIFVDNICNGFVNHAVLVVGYGTTLSGTDYWLIKNSWGTQWGESGYMRLRRNFNNMCGIATYGSVPILA